MAFVDVAPEISDDVDRLLAYQLQHATLTPAAGIEEIIKAIGVLADSPFLGRPLLNGMRELVIGSKARGVLGLYRYVEEIDTVFVLTVRSQREVGYPLR